MVGRGDGDGVDIFAREDVAEILFGLRALRPSPSGCRRRTFRMLLSTSQTCAMRAVLLVGLQRGKMGVGAAVEADDGEVEAVVGAHDLAVAAGGASARPAVAAAMV